MKSRFFRIVLMFLALHISATAALALFPGPFSFSFASSLLNNWFLLPFTLGGCG